MFIIWCGALLFALGCAGAIGYMVGKDTQYLQDKQRHRRGVQRVLLSHGIEVGEAIAVSEREWKDWEEDMNKGTYVKGLKNG